MKSFAHLPEEVLEEIFLRVPPKSLTSCKRVCKVWYAMISNQSFINKQLHTSIGNKHSPSVTLCLNWTRQEKSSLEPKRVLSEITIHDKGEDSGDYLPCVIEEISLPPIPETEKADFPVTLVGSHCNGIICFHDLHTSRKEAFVLCNPELGEFKLIQTPSLNLEFIFAGAGFGYDLKTDDYKCFKLFSSLDDENVSRALVYTLGTESWREIEIDLNCCCYLNIEGVYHRGFYYWWNMGTPSSKQMVLSFDLSEEEFHKIQLPEHAQDPRIRVKKLALWNESVVFFISTDNSQRSTSFEMWVMVDKSGDVEGSTYWTKHLTIGPLVNIHSPLAFWKDDELLMQTRDGRFVSYNLHSQKLRKLPMHGMVGPAATHAYLYSKSLVSIKRRKIGEVKGKSRLFIFHQKNKYW